MQPTPTIVGVDLMAWIEDNLAEFNWPTGTSVLWKDSEFFAFAAGGNARNDFHINPGEEVFIQLKGDIQVDYIDGEGRRQPNVIREGSVMLMPPLVPHAPRRPKGSWGFVVERRRAPDELDAWAWFCENCDNKLREFRMHIDNMDAQFNDVLNEFNASEEMRTCGRCGHVQTVPTEFVMEPAVGPAHAG